MARPHPDSLHRPKRSAGVLLVSGRRILLLRRSTSTRNAGLWGLPGGRLDPDESPWQAARREAFEEMGPLPPAAVVGELRVTRSKGMKRYDVFVCHAPAATRGTWSPLLDHEHDDHVWARLEWCLLNRDALHPVVRELFDDPAALRALCQVIERRPSLDRGGDRRVRIRPSRRGALAA